MRDLDALVGAHVAAHRSAAEDAGATLPLPDRGAHGIVGLVRSAADHWLDQPGADDPRAALRDHLSDLVWSGLAGILATGREVDTTADVRSA